LSAGADAGGGAPDEGLADEGLPDEGLAGEGRSEARKARSVGLAAPAPAAYPEAFEACWRAYPHIRGRSSKTKAFACWRRLPAATRARLAGAVARYAEGGREPKAECGAPAMERWLRDSRFLDWLEPDAAPQGAALRAFEGPAEIRAAVAAARGEDYARAWLDRCGWDAQARAVVSANGFVVDRLRSDLGQLLARLDARVARRPRDAAPPAPRPVSTALKTGDPA
jgi:hypothetical protein